MNKNEFIRRLATELSRLPESEVQEALRYYTEYIEDAGEENQEQVIRNLGSPAKIAAQIKADYAAKQLEIIGAYGRKDQEQKKKGTPIVLWIIMGIFAAPIALPLAIAGGAIVFALIVTCVALAVAMLICVVVVFGAGLVAIVAGFAALFTNFAGAMVAIGIGLAMVGAMLLAGMGIIVATKALVRVIAQKAHQKKLRKAMMTEGGTIR